MEDFNLDSVARKSVKSIFALVSRTFLIQILGIVSSLVLALYLSPSDFGIFFIVSSVVVFLNYFSDIGLAASLIQKKEEPSPRDLKIAFTTQQFLVILLVVPALILSPFIQDFFNLTSQGLLLFYAFLVSFLLSSLKTIPTVLLERKLDFHKLVLPQIAENLVYNVALIILAVNGYGLMSFVVAVVLRSIVGLFLMYIVMPWRIGFAWDLESFKKMASFGLPFQMNSLLALVKDDLINIYIGRVLPLHQVGYVGFAQKWAYMPLRLVLDNVIKIIFPSLSRLQHDEEALRKVIEKSLFAIALFIMPTAIGIILITPYFIEFIPKYAKWQPALISLAFFSLNSVFGSLSTPITNFLYAIGKSKITLYFMAFWTLLIWILTPVLVHIYGYNGVAMASFIVSVSTISIYFVARKYVRFSFFTPIFKPLIVTIIMGTFIFLTKDLLINSLSTLFIEILLAAGLYFILIYIFAKKEIDKTFLLVKESMRSK